MKQRKIETSAREEPFYSDISHVVDFVRVKKMVSLPNNQEELIREGIGITKYLNNFNRERSYNFSKL